MDTGKENEKDALSNPLGDDLLINVTIPKELKIEMVEASCLSDYQDYTLLTSVTSNAVVGFAVAAFTQEDQDLRRILWMVAGTFAVIMGYFIWMTIKKQKKMRGLTKSVKMRAEK